ncbi:MAG: hypothetical protein ABI684_14070 [Nitrospirota bacterium]
MKAIERLADGILLGTGAALALILIFLVSVHGMALHYALVGVVALGLFATRWLNASVKINLAFVVLSTLLAVYACELVLAVVASGRANFEATRWLIFPNDHTPESAQARLEQNSKDNPTFDRRDKLQVIKDLARQGVSAYPAVVPQNTLQWNPGSNGHRALLIDDAETLPLGGLSNVMTVFCNESGEYITYKSDEHGFHNPPGLWKNQQLEIVAVGDSFTHGACVPSEDSFVGVIRAHHPGTLNLGMDSNGPLLMLASLKEYAQRFRPKIVLWFYYEGNDLKDMENERWSPLLRRYLTGAWTQNLLDRQGEIDLALMEYIERARQNLRPRVGFEETIKLHYVRQSLALWYAGYKQDDAARIRSTRTYFSSEVTEEEINQFRSVLVEATSMVREWGGRLYFVYLPEYARYGQPELANKNRDRVLRLVTDLQLPLIDLHQVFAMLPDPVGQFPFRRSNHYNTEGHRLVGKEVLRVLSGMDVAVQKKPPEQ